MGDYATCVIRKVLAMSEIVITIVGNGYCQSGGEGPFIVTPSLSIFKARAFWMVETSGVFYFTEASGNYVRVLIPPAPTSQPSSSPTVQPSSMPTSYPSVALQPRILSTVAGNGTAGDSGNGRLALHAMVTKPYGIIADSLGNLYFAEYLSSRVRKISSDGIISAFIGTGISNQTGGSGPALSTTLDNPKYFAFNLEQTLLYFCGNYFIWCMNLTSNNVSVIAGAKPAMSMTSGDGGLAINARLTTPMQLFHSSNGLLYIAEQGGHRIRRIDMTSMIISTFAGNGTGGYSGEHLPANETMLYSPRGVWGNTKGEIYIADSSNHRIRLVDTSGLLYTIAGSFYSLQSSDGTPALGAAIGTPFLLQGDSLGNLYFSDFWSCRIRIIAAGSGILSTVIGSNGLCVNQGIGPYSANSAQHIGRSFGFWFTTFNDLYFTEYMNNFVRLISYPAPTSQPSSTPSGQPTEQPTAYPSEYQYPYTVYSISGNGTAGNYGEGGLAVKALVNSPFGIAKDTLGNVYFSEYNQYRIRRISADGIIDRFIGTGIYNASGVEGNALMTSIDSPKHLCFDTSGEMMYFSTSYYIWQFNFSSGNISIFAGKRPPAFAISSDGGPSELCKE